MHRRHLGPVPLSRHPSDSDMYTLGYAFKPWTEAKAIADGPSILKYVHETAVEYGIDRKIRFNHRVKRASWSSQDTRWTLEAERKSGDGASEIVRFTCNFLFMCSGYYKYEEGYTPEFSGTRISPAKSCIRRNGLTISTMRESAWW